jgi:PAS domain S-box-containing protein
VPLWKLIRIDALPLLAFLKSMRKVLKNVLLPAALLLNAELVSAANIFTLFKDEHGDTNWQHLANWTSGTLIILLTAAAIKLFISDRREKKANRALEENRNALEHRVLERTATLDESNRLLKETNLLLEGEITQHRETTVLLRSSETYIRDILESMPLVLIGINAAMTVTQWNRQAEELTGVSQSKALGKNLWDAYPIITVTPNQISKVQRENKPITIKHSQRGQCYYDISIYPLREQQETGIVILIDDVTQRILAENMLVQRDKMSSMGELASTMAHDIDVPLQAILKDIQSAKQTLATITGTDSIRAMLEDAAERGKQASGVISNLLDFAHSQGDKKRLANIIDIVEHTITLAEDVLSEPGGLHFRDISISRHYEKNLPQIRCNVSELQQVFFSLFRHAFKAMEQVTRVDFKPTVRIDIIECYDALWIKVQHNGVGLSNTEQQYIFEPFFNKTSVEEDQDIGKRLSFSYFIVTEHHQGQLAVTSDVNVGTTFHLQLQVK